ncbi:g10952 [Coccomyxa elongata]
MVPLYNDAAATQASILRQMEEERRTARSDEEPVSDKLIAGQEGSGKDTSRGVGSKRNRRSIMSFNDIIIWGWKGVYHQCKEIERVLAPHYRVRLTLHDYMFPHTDPADDGALYILMTPHLCVDLPPHYIIWQTEQWGHYMLQVGNRRWANQRNEPDLLDFVEVFEGAVEVWDYSLVHLKNFEPIFKGKDVKFRHVPFSWFPLDPPITEGEKNIDVLFYGWIVDGSRRNKMLDELRFERNVSIHVSNMDAYREDLTKLLRRAKVILNIHAYPAKVLEICRILEAISFGIVVITEPGVEAALDAQWKDKLVFVDGMDQIVQQIEAYKSNSTMRNQVLQAATAHAKAHYSLEMYLAEFLQHRRM